MRYCIYSDTEVPDVSIPVDLTYFFPGSNARVIPGSGTVGSPTYKPPRTVDWYCRNNALEFGGYLYRNSGKIVLPSVEEFTSIVTSDLVDRPLSTSPGYPLSGKINAHASAYGSIPAATVSKYVSDLAGNEVPSLPDADYTLLDGILVNISEIVSTPTGDLVITIDTKSWTNLPKPIPPGYTVSPHYPDPGINITYRFYYPLANLLKGSIRASVPSFKPNVPFQSRLSTYWVYLKFPPGTIVYNESTRLDWYGNGPLVASTGVPIAYKGAKTGSSVTIKFSTTPIGNQVRLVMDNTTKKPNAILFKKYNRRSSSFVSQERLHLPFFADTFRSESMSNDIDLLNSQLFVGGSFLPDKRFQKGVAFKPSTQTIPLNTETLNGSTYILQSIDPENYIPYVPHNVELTKSDTALQESRTFPINNISVVSKGTCLINSPNKSPFNFLNGCGIHVNADGTLKVQNDITINIPAGQIAIHDLGAAILSGSPVLPYFNITDTVVSRTLSSIQTPAACGWIREDWVQPPYVSTDIVKDVKLNYYGGNDTNVSSAATAIVKNFDAAGIGYIKALPTFTLKRRDYTDCFVSTINAGGDIVLYNKPRSSYKAGIWDYNSITDYESDPICNFTRRLTINNNAGASATYNGNNTATKESNYSTRIPRLTSTTAAIGDCYISVANRGALTAHNVQVNMFGGVANKLGSNIGAINLSSTGSVSITGCSILNMHRTPPPTSTVATDLSGGERIASSSYRQPGFEILGVPLSSETLQGVYGSIGIYIHNPVACNYFVSKNIINTGNSMDIYLAGLQSSSVSLSSAIIDNIIYNSTNIGLKIEDTRTTYITGNYIYNVGNAAAIDLTSSTSKALTGVWPYERNTGISIDRTSRAYIPLLVTIGTKVKENKACFNSNIGMYARHIVGDISSGRLAYNVNYGLYSVPLKGEVPAVVHNVFAHDNHIGIGIVGSNSEITQLSATNITAFNNNTHGIYTASCDVNIQDSMFCYNGRGITIPSESFGIYSMNPIGQGTGIYIDKSHIGDVTIMNTSCFHNNIVKRSNVNTKDQYKEQIIIDASNNENVAYSDLHIRNCIIGQFDNNGRLSIGPILTLNSIEACALSTVSPYNSSSLTLEDEFGIGLIRPRFTSFNVNHCTFEINKKALTTSGSKSTSSFFAIEGNYEVYNCTGLTPTGQYYPTKLTDLNTIYQPYTKNEYGILCMNSEDTYGVHFKYLNDRVVSSRTYDGSAVEVVKRSTVNITDKEGSFTSADIINKVFVIGSSRKKIAIDGRESQSKSHFGLYKPFLDLNRSIKSIKIIAMFDLMLEQPDGNLQPLDTSTRTTMFNLYKPRMIIYRNPTVGINNDTVAAISNTPTDGFEVTLQSDKTGVIEVSLDIEYMNAAIYLPEVVLVVKSWNQIIS